MLSIRILISDRGPQDVTPEMHAALASLIEGHLGTDDYALVITQEEVEDEGD